MTQSRRKAIGVVLTLLSIIVWAALAVWLFELLGVADNTIATLIYFIVAGLGWTLPAMAIISWMSRPD